MAVFSNTISDGFPKQEDEFDSSSGCYYFHYDCNEQVSDKHRDDAAFTAGRRRIFVKCTDDTH